MILWMTRDEDKVGGIMDLHVKEPGPKDTKGEWFLGLFSTCSGSQDFKERTAFAKAFALKPGGGPLKVELRKVE